MASGDTRSFRPWSRRVCLSRSRPLTRGYCPAIGWGLQGPVPARWLGGTEQGAAACAAPLRGLGKGGGGAGERGGSARKGMREEVPADPAPPLKGLQGCPTTGPPSLAPRPVPFGPGLPPRGGAWGLRVPLCLAAPPSSSRLPSSSWCLPMSFISGLRPSLTLLCQYGGGREGEAKKNLGTLERKWSKEKEAETSINRNVCN